MGEGEVHRLEQRLICHLYLDALRGGEESFRVADEKWLSKECCFDFEEEV